MSGTEGCVRCVGNEPSDKWRHHRPQNIASPGSKGEQPLSWLHRALKNVVCPHLYHANFPVAYEQYRQSSDRLVTVFVWIARRTRASRLWLPLRTCRSRPGSWGRTAQRLAYGLLQGQYPREDSNKRDPEAENADSSEAGNRIRHTSRIDAPCPTRESLHDQDPDLVLIHERWPELSEHIKQTILILIRSSSADGKSKDHTF